MEQKKCECAKTVNLQSMQGEELASWCKHLYIMNEVGLGEWTDDKSIVESRIASPTAKYLVFFDLDETLTTTNDGPNKTNASSDQLMQEYFSNRVEQDLKDRVAKLFQRIKKRDDIVWFILTDNIYASTKCTLKLAHDIDVPLGSIIDRVFRAKHYNSMTKAEFLKYVAEKRDGIKILFVDNDLNHQQTATEVFSKIAKLESLVCCQNLVTGLTDEHVEQINRFLHL